MGTGVKLILVGSGAFVALVLLIGVVVAAVLLAPRSGGRPALVSRPGVVFDDDFSTNRGWDVTPVEGFTTDIHLGTQESYTWPSRRRTQRAQLPEIKDYW